MKFYTFLVALFLSVSIAAQSNSSTPYSLKNEEVSLFVPMTNMETVDVNALLAEDEQNYTKGSKYRVGVVHQVQLSMENSGEWQTLKDGGKLWRVGITSLGADMLNLHFGSFKITDGAEVFIYDTEYETVLGPYNGTHIHECGYFYSEDVLSENIIVEYYQPGNVQGEPEVVIDQVGHIYRSVKGPYGSADGACHINVNCLETHREQINSVVLLRMQAPDGIWVCSGAMINNVANDNTPYVLSAEHCYASNISSWYTFFDHQTTDCDGTGYPPNHAISGASLVARDNSSTSSDFLLLKLPVTTANTAKLQQYNPYMAGWDNRGTVIPATPYGVHHPGGDYKKYSKPKTIVSYQKFWEVTWYPEPDNLGVTEGGSSGSPLFNAEGLIVGDLCCGTSSCEYESLELQGPTGSDLYGKLSNSWTNSNNSSDSKKLKPWLDPNNTGATTLLGRYYNDEVSVKEYYTTPQTLHVYPNPSNGNITLDGDFNIENAQVKVYSLLGEMVANISLKNNAINLSTLPNGMYHIQLIDGNKVFQNKLIIAK